ncbi:MAG: dTDP-4-dehydrorhamnose 3,5-epimerase family protein [Gemmatimonadetes bacterium]|nr:dTDP-4-dehydrorhamnose 3,5-epimerase family protein [Gemmatimonadota bacterium]
MIFTPAPLAGAFVLDVERQGDDRGFFARSFATVEFEAHGLDPRVAQCNISYNNRRGILRGMHWQAEPHGEAKLVRCTAGAIFDVIVDIREGSPTRYQWFGVELHAATRRALYVPVGFAHGFQVLADETEVFYQMSVPFHGPAGRGLNPHDPRLAISWPLRDAIMNERDRSYPFLGPDA